MKKFLAILLAAMMLLSVVAFAEGTTTYKITIEQPLGGHTYEAYQIFAGVLSKNESGQFILSDIVWGNGISDDAKAAYDKVYGNAAEFAKTLTTESEARSFADSMQNKLATVAGTCSKTANEKGPYVIEGLQPGYYLIKDKDQSLSQDKLDAYTLYIMRVVGDAIAYPKSNVPTSEKKVKDINDSTDNAPSSWQDSADWDIGDEVPFQISGTVSEKFEDFVAIGTPYKVIFHDDQSDGLTAPSYFKAYAVAPDDSRYDFKDSEFTVAMGEGENANDFTVTFSDLTKIFAEDGETCVIKGGSTIYVEYVSILDIDAKIGVEGNPNVMYMQFSNNPYVEDNFGRTPDDKVIVFTYKLVVNKLDSAKQPLEGAQFTLEKMDSSGKNVKEVIKLTVEGNTFSAVGIDDGVYRLTETVAPTNYNKLNTPIIFTVRADHNVLSDDPKLISFTGNLSSGNATFTFEHVDSNNPTAGGNVSTDVINNAGASLPETGGIGTTLFYVFGSLMFVGAALILVVRRRAEAEEN